MANRPRFPGRPLLGGIMIFVAQALTVPGAALADPAQRVVVLREGATLSLLAEPIALKLLKIRGYSIDVRMNGMRQTLKKGQTVSLDGGTCSVTFRKISPETRIARFLTDCPLTEPANG